jgi:transposase
MAHKPSPSAVSDEEWALVAPYLPLMTEDAPQRESPLRQVFNGLRWLVGAGAHWRMMPHDLPPLAGHLPADPVLAHSRRPS